MPVRYWSNFISVLTFSGYKKQSQNLNIVTNLENPARSCPENGRMATLNKQTDYKYQKLRKPKSPVFEISQLRRKKIKLYQQK